MRSNVVAIRLLPQTREALTAEAKKLNLGISEYLRKLAEAKALEVEYARVREEGRLYMERLRQDPDAMEEVKFWLAAGAELWDSLPPWTGPLPGDDTDDAEVRQ